MSRIEEEKPTDGLSPESTQRLEWMVKVFESVDKVCPAGPVNPDTPGFKWRIEDGADSAKLLANWDDFVEEYTDDDGTLNFEEYADWEAEIPCPDCETPVRWARAIGFNNHIAAGCPDCKMSATQ